MLLSNRFLDRWRFKYELKQVSYTDSFFHAKMIYMMLYMNNHPSIFELKQVGIEEITHNSFSSIQIIRLHYMNNPSSTFYCFVELNACMCKYAAGQSSTRMGDLLGSPELSW